MSMADSPDETDSSGDPGDDGQLTIRIPNPKVYMARQSQWKGRRGKPRCDHCRLNNLKCDRVLPTCNHCSWANGRDCKYTPLPTPAHRGIPRCDRCRIQNLKCDRNLPICNHCSEEDAEDICNYTPKKRHKVPEDHVALKDGFATPYAAKTASFLIADMSPEEHGDSEPVESFSSNGEKPSFSTRDYVRGRSPSVDMDELPEPLMKPLVPYGDRRSERDNWAPPKPSLPPLAPKGVLVDPSSSPSMSRSCFLDQRAILVPPRIDPWYHPAFASLPEVVLYHVRAANAMEMPTRQAFDEALSKFLEDLSPELKETATFEPEVYAALAESISKEDMSVTVPRRLTWVEVHHIRSGSQKFHLLLLPRDAYYQMKRADEEKLRLEYIARTDAIDPSPAARSPLKDSVEDGLDAHEWTMAYERIPVQTQIYDVLVYAHRSHGSSSSMLFEARRVGIATITWPMVEIFTRLCPLCNLRAKSGGVPPIPPLSIGAGETSGAKR